MHALSLGLVNSARLAALKNIYIEKGKNKIKDRNVLHCSNIIIFLNISYKNKDFTKMLNILHHILYFSEGELGCPVFNMESTSPCPSVVVEANIYTSVEE